MKFGRQQTYQISHLKPWRQEESRTFLSPEKEKEVSTMTFIFDKTILPEKGGNKTFQTKEN